MLFEEKKEIDGKMYWIGHTPEYVKAAMEADPAYGMGNRIVKGTAVGFLEEDIMLLK